MIRKLLNLLCDRVFLLYAAIGITGVIIDFVAYLLLVSLGISPIVASVISVSLGIINNFLLNAHYNFKRKDHLWYRFFIFYLVGTTGIVLSALFIALFHDVFGTSAIAAKLISIPPIVLFQYWFNKNASFAVNHKHIPWRQLVIFSSCVLVLVVFAFNAPYFSFSDEADNLLGAQAIARDQLIIYRDYFSHHMPLAYFMGAPFFMIFGTKIISIKIAFSLVMGSWLLMMARNLLSRYGVYIFLLFISLVSLSQVLLWSHMLLAETVIAFATIHALIIYLTRITVNRSTLTDSFVLALLGCLPVFGALSYAPLSLLIYVILCIQLIKLRPSLPKLLAVGLSAMLPYVLFGIYLVINQAFHDFIDQALRFNTLYYSQFTPDATRSITDSIFSIIQGSLGSFYHAITFDDSIVHKPISFLFAVCIVLSISYLISRKKIGVSILFVAALLFGSARSGFGSLFSGYLGSARTGIIPALVGFLLFMYVLHQTSSVQKLSDPLQKSLAILTRIGIYGVALFVILSSSAAMATIGREYLRGQSLIQPPASSNSVAGVINLVNTDKDYYWVGPLDFSSQLVITSKNASRYRFYAPWHAVCASCVDEVKHDLRSHNPRVIYLDTEMMIWGHKVDEYARPLVESFRDQYYRVKDPRLIHFYFEKSQKSQIDQILISNGYGV